MAYKFQIGAAEMGGALTQEGALVVESSISGSTTLAAASLAVDGKVAGSELSSSANLNAGGNLVVAGTVKLAGVAAAAVDVAADSLYILDGDGLMKKESFSDYAAALAGTSITATSGVLTVSDNGVTLAKMAGLARGKFIVGDASGDPSALALGTSGQFLVSDNDDAIWRSLSGDATLGADGALTIENDAVEQAMIADDAVGADQLASNAVVNASVASGAAIAYSKMESVATGNVVVGNGSGVGTIVAISGDCTLAGSGALTIADNAVSLAKMAGLARGKIIVGDSSGDPSALSVGSAHQFFQSDGTDAAWVSMSGDVTLAAGVATIGAGAVEHGMLNDNIISGQNALGGASVAQADLLMLDDGPGTVKKVTFSNFEDSIFGNISGDATVAAGGALTIAPNAVEGSMLNTDVISGQTALASGLAGTDELMVSDGGTLKRMDISVLSSFQAGAGLTATNGVLSLDSAGTPTGFGDAAATMVEGVNYGTTTLTADRVWTLPGSPSEGDVVRIKAPAAMGGNRIVVTPAAGTIDGQATIDLDSPGAAVALIYLTTNVWGIF